VRNAFLFPAKSSQKIGRSVRRVFCCPDGQKGRCEMKLLVSSKIRMVLVGFVAAFLVSGGGNANANFIFGTPTNLGPTINSSYADGLVLSPRNKVC
jgi:hypothetical protein